MKIVILLRAVLEILPLLAAIIRAVEDAVPGEGAGEAKLAAVRLMLEGAYKTGGDIAVTFESLWGVLQPAISGLVAALNATGWRK